MTMDYKKLKKQTLLDEDTCDIIMGYLAVARAIAWDTCHKLYIALDEDALNLLEEYDPLIMADTMTTEQLFNTVVSWFTSSCNFRFIQVVVTTDDSQRFVNVVRQGSLHTSLHNV
jgi:hypothetical protein